MNPWLAGALYAFTATVWTVNAWHSKPARRVRAVRRCRRTTRRTLAMATNPRTVGRHRLRRGGHRWDGRRLAHAPERGQVHTAGVVPHFRITPARWAAIPTQRMGQPLEFIPGPEIPGAVRAGRG